MVSTVLTTCLLLTAQQDVGTRLDAIEKWITDSTPAIAAFRKQHDDKLRDLDDRVKYLESLPEPASLDKVLDAIERIQKAEPEGGGETKEWSWKDLLQTLGSLAAVFAVGIHTELSRRRSNVMKEKVEEVKEEVRSAVDVRPGVAPVNPGR